MVEIRRNGEGTTHHIAEPLCGMDWLRQHLHDHTHAEIESLSIQVGIDGRTLPAVRASDTRGTIKNIVKEFR